MTTELIEFVALSAAVLITVGAFAWNKVLHTAKPDTKKAGFATILALVVDAGASTMVGINTGSALVGGITFFAGALIAYLLGWLAYQIWWTF